MHEPLQGGKTAGGTIATTEGEPDKTPKTSKKGRIELYHTRGSPTPVQYIHTAHEVGPLAPLLLLLSAVVTVGPPCPACHPTTDGPRSKGVS